MRSLFNTHWSVRRWVAIATDKRVSVFASLQNPEEIYNLFSHFPIEYTANITQQKNNFYVLTMRIRTVI